MKLSEFTASHFAAAVAALLVSYGSSAVIVYQAAQSFGATPEQMNSWFTSLGLGCGLLTLWFSIRLKMPVMFAWCTPGAALMIGMSGISLPQAVAAFMFAACLMLLVSASGWFDRLAKMIPTTLASAMLAGILINFGSRVFVSMQAQTLMVALMLITYLLVRIRLPRYSILLMLAVGLVYTVAAGLLKTEHLVLVAPALQWVNPEFHLGAIISVGIPLFVAALVSQNVPGMAVMRVYNYDTPGRPLINSSAATTLLLASFGAFMLNLAAISAAICMGSDVDKDPKRRYYANIIMGCFYLLMAACGGMVVNLFAALPNELLVALAGIAIFGTLQANLVAAWADEPSREASLLTLLVTASGMTLWSIGSAFWGLLIGVAVYHLNVKTTRK